MDGLIIANQKSTDIANQGSEILDPMPISISTSISAHTLVMDPFVILSRPTYYNLAVKQKVAYQPMFRFRR